MLLLFKSIHSIINYVTKSNIKINLNYNTDYALINQFFLTEHLVRDIPVLYSIVHLNVANIP